MFGLSIISTAKLDVLKIREKELFTQISLVKALSDRNIELAGEMTTTSLSAQAKINSAIRNHEAVVTAAETNEAKYSLFRKVVSATEDVKTLYDFRSFLNKQITRFTGTPKVKKGKKAENSQVIESGSGDISKILK